MRHRRFRRVCKIALRGVTIQHGVGAILRTPTSRANFSGDTLGVFAERADSVRKIAPMPREI